MDFSSLLTLNDVRQGGAGGGNQTGNFNFRSENTKCALRNQGMLIHRSGTSSSPLHASSLLGLSIFLFYFPSGIIPTLINLKQVPDREAWMQVPGNIYIGRSCHGMKEGSEWANPYKINHLTTREASLKKYESMLLRNGKLQDSLSTLCYSQLGCWCAPLPCHGNILIDQIKKGLLYDIDFI